MTLFAMMVVLAEEPEDGDDQSADEDKDHLDPVVNSLVELSDDDLTAGWRQFPAALQRWVGSPLVSSVIELPPFDRGQQLVRLIHLCSQEATLLSHHCRNPPIVPGPDKEGECSDQDSAAEAMDSLS